MRVSPDETRNLSYKLRHYGGELERAAFSLASNDKNRDQRDRTVVHNLYRSIALRTAFELLENLGVNAVDLDSEQHHMFRIKRAIRDWDEAKKGGPRSM